MALPPPLFGAKASDSDFAQLVRGGYLTLEELEPIGEEKLNQIEKMVNFKGF